MRYAVTLAILAAGCAVSHARPPRPDAGADAGTDAEVDAGTDAGRDAGACPYRARHTYSYWTPEHCNDSRAETYAANYELVDAEARLGCCFLGCCPDTEPECHAGRERYGTAASCDELERAMLGEP